MSRCILLLKVVGPQPPAPEPQCLALVTAAIVCSTLLDHCKYTDVEAFSWSPVPGVCDILSITWYFTVASSNPRLIPVAKDCLMHASQAAAPCPHSKCQKSQEACCALWCSLWNASNPLGFRISLTAFAAHARFREVLKRRTLC